MKANTNTKRKRVNSRWISSLACASYSYQYGRSPFSRLSRFMTIPALDAWNSKVLCQRSAASGHGVDSAADLGVFDQRRSVIWLTPCVDHQASLAAPVFVLGRSSNPVDIRCRVAASEHCPEKVIQCSSRKLAVANNQDHGKLIDRIGWRESLAK